ncbi:glycosyltransferase [Nocardioides sp. NPDC051685]|uniref:glycosyltransferase n=1 Tax=Nocardioides sp. NPDC051685 TaxID=3364334 RepID=UPI00378E555B
MAILRHPWRLPLFALRLLACWIALVMGSIQAQRSGAPDAVLVGYMGHFDIHLARILYPRATILLDHMVSAAGVGANRHLASAGGLKHRLLKAIDTAALSRADIVIVDTDEHQKALPEHVRTRSVVCPVGATRAWLEAGADALREPTDDVLRVVFVGLFSPAHGTPVIGEALDMLSDDARIQVTMVGRGQEYSVTRLLAARNPHVTWVDWVAPEELPTFVAGFDVSLGIFGTVPQALNVVPTKAFQGAAAGCVIVTSETEPQRRALDGAALLAAPGSAIELAAALRKLAGDPDVTHQLRRAAHAHAGGRYLPGAVVAPLMDRITAA